MKARAVTDEARRRVDLEVVLNAAVCDGRAAGGGCWARRGGRGHRAMMMVDMDLGGRKERQTNEAAAVYTYGHLVRARNINSTRQAAPNLPGARGRISLAVDPWTSERDNNLRRLCFATSVRAGFGRCFDGETKPDVFRNKAAPFMLPADSRSTPASSCPGACEPRAWVASKANAGTEATVEARMLQRTSPVLTSGTVAAPVAPPACHPGVGLAS